MLNYSIWDEQNQQDVTWFLYSDKVRFVFSKSGSVTFSHSDDLTYGDCAVLGDHLINIMNSKDIRIDDGLKTLVIIFDPRIELLDYTLDKPLEYEIEVRTEETDEYVTTIHTDQKVIDLMIQRGFIELIKDQINSREKVD